MPSSPPRAEGAANPEKAGERPEGERIAKRIARAGLCSRREAEACFRQALAVSRRQQAKSWELRAGMSLSRLYRQQGRLAEARPLLAEAYGWFTEGLDTPDLQEAKALLKALPT